MFSEQEPIIIFSSFKATHAIVVKRNVYQNFPKTENWLSVSFVNNQATMLILFIIFYALFYHSSPSKGRSTKADRESVKAWSRLIL